MLEVSLWREVVWGLRFRRRRRLSAQFRDLELSEAKAWSEDRRFAPYADWAERIAEINTPWGPERWLIFSRDWSGWPDPPEFLFVALDAHDQLVAAVDFDDKPSAWVWDD